MGIGPQSRTAIQQIITDIAVTLDGMENKMFFWLRIRDKETKTLLSCSVHTSEKRRWAYLHKTAKAIRSGSAWAEDDLKQDAKEMGYNYQIKPIGSELEFAFEDDSIMNSPRELIGTDFVSIAHLDDLSDCWNTYNEAKDWSAFG